MFKKQQTISRCDVHDIVWPAKHMTCCPACSTEGIPNAWIYRIHVMNAGTVTKSAVESWLREDKSFGEYLLVNGLASKG